jgi:hypothetical protein
MCATWLSASQQAVAESQAAKRRRATLAGRVRCYGYVGAVHGLSVPVHYSAVLCQPPCAVCSTVTPHDIYQCLALVAHAVGAAQELVVACTCCTPWQ